MDPIPAPPSATDAANAVDSRNCALSFFTRAPGVWLIAGGILLSWILSYVVAHGYVPLTDAVMYALPFSAHSPSLGIPMIGDFSPYDTAWGHQWPGAMAIKQIIFAIVPYSYQNGIFTSYLLVLLGASMLYLAVRLLAGQLWMAVAAGVMAFCDPVFYFGSWATRIEPYAWLGVNLFFLSAIHALKHGLRGKWVFLTMLGGVIAVACHPISLIAAAVFSGISLLCWFRGVKGAKALSLFWIGGCFLGALFMVWWFSRGDGAWEQFLTNLEVLKSFWVNRWTLWRQFSHINYAFSSGYLFLFATVIASFIGAYKLFKALVEKRVDPLTFVFATAGVANLVVVAYYITKGLSNDKHLLCIRGCFVMALVAAFYSLRPHWPRFAKAFAVVVCIMATLNFGFVASRIAKYIKIGHPDVLGGIRAAMSPPFDSTRQIIISPGLWPALHPDEYPNVRLWTFSVASKPYLHERVERDVYSQLKKGAEVFYEANLLETPDKIKWNPTFADRGYEEPYWKKEVVYDREIMGQGKVRLRIIKATLMDESWFSKVFPPKSDLLHETPSEPRR